MADSFLAWRRPAITGLAVPGAFAAGRLLGRLEVTLTDDAGPVAGRAEFVFAGPGDARGLQPGVIVGRKPAPGTVDAEHTRVAHVEFSDPGLPWRYSPEPNAPALRPWLVLVLGLTGMEILVGGGRARILRSALDQHPLAQSAAWAHVHAIDGAAPIARILSPREPPIGAALTAVLVPAFVANGDGPPRPAWDAVVPEVSLPCFDAWSFRTIDEDDDFRAIAARLAPLTGAEEAALAAADFGRAAVASAAGAAPLATRGALGVIPAPASDPLPEAVAARTESLAEVSEADGRWVLGLPRYDAPWAGPDATVPAAGWRRQLRVDPRARGGAGLGAWAAIAWQDRIAAAAARQAGALALLAERVRHLTLGLRGSRSQWLRRVPADPLAGLAVVGPMLPRVPSGGATVIDALAGRTARLVPALFSSAARRMLRPRNALARLAAPGATDLAALIDAAATRCPPGAEPLPGQEELGKLVADPERRAEAARRLAQEAGGLLEAAMAAMPEGSVEDVRGLFETLPGFAGPLVDGLNRPPVPDDCRPIADLRVVAGSILDGISPMAARPPVVARVIGDFAGVRQPELAPPDLPFELDIPLWSFLRDAAPDWLLPGGGKVPPDRLLPLQTNPDFVDAMLIGANQRTLGELRWRNIPIVTGWTPLRRFWQRIADGGGAPAVDLRPVLDILTAPAPGAPIWSDRNELGAAAHQAGGAGPQLVVLLHTEIFRRYPATLVYLLPNPGGTETWQQDVTALPWAPVWPNLSGALDSELVFFGFPLPPEAAASHWLVLEEPPPGFRFRVPTDAERGMIAAADYASATLYPPVRAFFGNLL